MCVILKRYILLDLFNVTIRKKILAKNLPLLWIIVTPDSPSVWLQDFVENR